MALIIEMSAGECIRIGDVLITLEEKKGRNRSRIKIDAPRSVTIERGIGKKAQECHISQQVRGDTHGTDHHRPC